MRRSLRLGLALSLLCWGSAARPARADADSLVDTLGPAETGVGEAKRAAAIGALATRLNPAGLPLSTELVFDGGYGYRPGDSASIFELAACDSTNAMPGCFYYSYVGSTLDDVEGDSMKTRAHTGGITLSRPLGRKLIFGSGIKYFDVEENGMDAGHGVNWDIGTTLRATETLNLALVGYNLWGAKSEHFPRAFAGGVQLRPMPQLSASFDAVWNLDAPEGEKTGRYGGGLEYFLVGAHGTTGYPIRAGAIHDVSDGGTHVTAGLGFVTLKMGIDVGARKQVSGGDELLITAAIRVYGPRQPQ
jgi:hypothetical protein